jgi:hypothetical protein
MAVNVLHNYLKKSLSVDGFGIGNNYSTSHLMTFHHLGKNTSEEATNIRDKYQD